MTYCIFLYLLCIASTLVPCSQKNRFSTYSAEELLSVGVALRSMGDYKKAIPYLRAAVLQDTDIRAHPQALYELSCAYLAGEQFTKGFALLDQYAQSVCPLNKPWRGEKLQGKTIVVYAPEWGDGDHIMFARYLYQLKSCGPERIVYVISSWLQYLCALGLHISGLIIETATAPFVGHTDYHHLRFAPLISQYAADYEVTILSLPTLLAKHAPQRSLDEQTPYGRMPYGRTPYLFADPQRDALWKNLLADDHKFKIGLCWQGANRSDTQLQQRSIPLALLAPLLTHDLSYYALQKGAGRLDRATVPEAQVIKQYNLDDDGAYVDTIALINNLDLIITVDTSIAHLAGAAGKPVWVMLPHAAEWRYGTTRTHSLWYPTMRLFRQKKSGDWQSVIAELSDALMKQTGEK